MAVDLKLLESRAGFISILVIEINSRAINFADFLPINSCKKITLAIFNEKKILQNMKFKRVTVASHFYCLDDHKNI